VFASRDREEVDSPVTKDDARSGAAAPATRLRYGFIIEGEEVIDDVLVSFGPGGGVPLVDISCHGGVRIVERILLRLENAGAPLGQATTAGIWGARDPVDEEALAALQSAKTWRAAEFAAWQRQHLPAALLAIANLCPSDPQEALRRLDELTARGRAARVLLDGLTVALVGPPNSGKSTLFNCLVGRQAAVVSPIAGTTRDWVAAELEVEGVPITLLDTPGRHGTADPLELAALSAAHERTRSADGVIVVLDSSSRLPSNVAEFVAVTSRGGGQIILAINKVDSPPAWSPTELPAELARLATCRVCAIRGEGVPELLAGFVEHLGELRAPAAAFFTARQLRLSVEVRELICAGELGQASEKIQCKFIAAACRTTP
jgi:tRNA modification GTPase